jgi:hypothetical protein
MGSCEKGTELSISRNVGNFFFKSSSFFPSDKEFLSINFILQPLVMLQRVIGYGLHQCRTANA